jgi:mono/diheme cytochrome c family protein/glucose/arabinose dehydrogenase
MSILLPAIDVQVMKYNIFLFAILLLAAACRQSGVKTGTDSLAMRQQVPASPVLSATEAIKHMKIAPGLEVQLVAAEPLVTTPVALTFDEKGRMWVVEMTGYMPDTVGTGEDAPSGKVVILEDTDHDGMMDSRKVFADSLVLPRAICLVDSGVLVAEPPKLWYIPNHNDHPGKRILVDDHYADGGNVEHQPNGLYRAMDNWIYNAKSDKRYRKVNGKWLKENTHFRGQWGISQDDYGRLFYNNNSENLLGDYFPPGLGSHNPNLHEMAGYNERIVPDNRVYPIRPTPGVNRGYMKGTLDDSLRLREMTAACSPLIYRGGLLKGYEGNAFVAEPAGNLIKRNILQDSAGIVKGKQAWQHQEFLASDDERFRPVGLYDGPDGALYIVDMYRGIIQHKTYLTPYLKNEIKERNLTLPLNAGRIYRVVPTGAKPQPVLPKDLISAINSPNGWVRDKAQQLIVDAHNTSLKDTLSLATYHGNINALWALEGIGQLQWGMLRDMLMYRRGTATQQQVQEDLHLKQQELATLPSIINAANRKEIATFLQSIDFTADLAPHIALLLPYLSSPELQADLLKRYPDNHYVVDAIIDNAAGKEAALLQQFPDTTNYINKRLKGVIKDIEKGSNAAKTEALAKQYPRGAKLFNTVCQTCHGKDGEGVQSLAPNFNQSEIVTGDKHKVISIVLYGLTGPVTVSGKQFKGGDMPGIGSNTDYKDEDIAEVISFIRNCWSNKAPAVTAQDVQAVRAQYKGRQKAFVIEELK